MQNNNSKLIIVLLLILIVLVALCFWKLNMTNRVSDDETRISSEEVITEETEEPVVVKPSPKPVAQDPVVTFLKGLVAAYPYAEIKECHWAEGRQFTLYKDRRTADSSITIYNENGVIMDTCPTFYPAGTTISGTCQAMQGCGDLIYGMVSTGGFDPVTGSPKGYIVDTYNLD